MTPPPSGEMKLGQIFSMQQSQNYQDYDDNYAVGRHSYALSSKMNKSGISSPSNKSSKRRKSKKDKPLTKEQRRNRFMDDEVKSSDGVAEYHGNKNTNSQSSGLRIGASPSKRKSIIRKSDSALIEAPISVVKSRATSEGGNLSSAGSNISARDICQLQMIPESRGDQSRSYRRTDTKQSVPVLNLELIDPSNESVTTRIKGKEINIEDIEDRAHSSERRDQVASLRENK